MGSRAADPTKVTTTVRRAPGRDPEEEWMRLRGPLQDTRRRRQEALAREARLRAERIARTLKSKYGAEKVFLYGSLAWGGFREDSDIDLLVCGYQGSYWDILVEVERLASPFQVSLVGLEDASPSLRAEVFARGVPL